MKTILASPASEHWNRNVCMWSLPFQLRRWTRTWFPNVRLNSLRFFFSFNAFYLLLFPHISWPCCLSHTESKRPQWWSKRFANSSTAAKIRAASPHGHLRFADPFSGFPARPTTWGVRPSVSACSSSLNWPMWPCPGNPQALHAWTLRKALAQVLSLSALCLHLPGWPLKGGHVLPPGPASRKSLCVNFSYDLLLNRVSPSSTLCSSLTNVNLTKSQHRDKPKLKDILQHNWPWNLQKCRVAKDKT